ncbi:MAG: YIP1 family protein [Acidobacteria bacterium]|nr:YIP1 family protein [Acidobacteriota bacterium]
MPLSLEPGRATDPRPTTAWRCLNCNRVNRPGAMLCGDCGVAWDPDALVLDDEPLVAPPPPTPETTPFLTIWTEPRETIRWIVDARGSWLVTPLILAAGFISALDQASLRSLGDRFPLSSVILFALVTAPLSLVVMRLISIVAEWTGAKLGGSGHRDDIRTALAWASVPYLEWSLIAWPLMLSLFGSALFRTAAPELDTANPIIVTGMSVLQLIVLGWTFYASMQGLAEVHRFSFGKAVLSWFLAILTFAAALLLCALVLTVMTAGT